MQALPWSKIPQPQSAFPFGKVWVHGEKGLNGSAGLERSSEIFKSTGLMVRVEKPGLAELDSIEETLMQARGVNLLGIQSTLFS